MDFGKYRLELYDRLGVCAIDRSITNIRSMFRHACETGLIDQPVRLGGQFAKPTRKEKRQNRSERDRLHGKRLFSAKEIRTLLDEAGPQLRAMILLGINGGSGNTDCAELPVKAVDLKKRVIDYDRPKTAAAELALLASDRGLNAVELFGGDGLILVHFIHDRSPEKPASAKGLLYEISCEMFPATASRATLSLVRTPPSDAAEDQQRDQEHRSADERGQDVFTVRTPEWNAGAALFNWRS